MFKRDKFVAVSLRGCLPPKYGTEERTALVEIAHRDMSIEEGLQELNMWNPEDEIGDVSRQARKASKVFGGPC